MTSAVQTIITLALVGAATLYLGVLAWRFYRRAGSSEGGSCGGAAKKPRRVRLEPTKRRKR